MTVGAMRKNLHQHLWKNLDTVEKVEEELHNVYQWIFRNLHKRYLIAEMDNTLHYLKLRRLSLEFGGITINEEEDEKEKDI